MTYDPFVHAESLGVSISYEVTPARKSGFYLHGERRIVLSSGLSGREARCVLAHEVVHAECGHLPVADLPVHWKRERHCDVVAAHRLIDYDDLMAAVRVSGDPGEWCAMLNVTADLLETFIYSSPFHHVLNGT